MAPPITRSKPRNTLEQAVIEEIEKARDDGDLEFNDHAEPRCHVCCEQESREFVNALIMAGMTNREITDQCRGINRRRTAAKDKRLIEARNVWSHRKNHFNVDKGAREIMERRAFEANLDYVNGVGHAVTPYATIETVMVKGYQRITQTEEPSLPSVKETLDAAVKLHELTAKDAGTKKLADLMYTMGRIIDAAEEFIPVEHREAFLARVEGRSSDAKPLGVLTDRVHEQAAKVIKDFMPNRSNDEGDDI